VFGLVSFILSPPSPCRFCIACYKEGLVLINSPGRIYSLGPAETLNNFEVHLKNRGHRENVQARVGKE
jgi:hypothetical protein